MYHILKSQKYYQFSHNSHKPLDRAKKSTTDSINAASKRAIKKAAEVTGDLIGNKIADKKQMFRKSLLKNYKMTK